MDNKRLITDRPPAYNAVPGTYEYGQQPQPQPQHNYGAIGPPPPPPPAPGFQPPPPPYQYPVPVPYPDGQGYPVGSSHGGVAVSQQPCYSSTYTIIQPSVVVVGGCPACRVGVLEDDFTCLGILCAIAFFPLGILFCLALRQRRCPNCGATFG